MSTDDESGREGALQGIRVVEFGGVGPAPFGAMLLADHGADVIRIDRPDTPPVFEGYMAEHDPLLRGRPCIEVDLKRSSGVELVRRLIGRADVLLDPYRPGVLERLGLGPSVLLRSNPRLVFARMTGWGQDGPLARAAGHDINYLALSGALAAFGEPAAPPMPPLNLVGDFGGGGMLLVVAVLAALLERERSGEGQVIDVSIVDGVALQFACVLGMRNMGAWTDTRGSNLLDGGAPFYRTYATVDGGYLAVGAIEPQFYRALLDGVGLEHHDWPQWDRERWPALTSTLSATFGQKSRAEWLDRFGPDSDACVTAVLDVREAVTHEQNAFRGVYVTDAHGVRPAVAPRFSRTPGRREPSSSEFSEGRLADWGISNDELLAAAG